MGIKKRKLKGLVIERLENVSKDVFSKHYSLIKELIGNYPGVYALYDSNGLYYVGKSTDLKNRVKHHLRDRHYALWSHFSLYLVRKEAHINEIESLLVRIANPRGNKVVPRGKAKNLMLKKLKRMVKEKQKEEFSEMFGAKRTKMGRKKKIKARHPQYLKDLVHKKTSILATYKGKEHKAMLTPKGLIIYKGKTYKTPSGAGKAVIDRGAVNGWHFWYIKDVRGEWVKLVQYSR